MFAWCKEDKWGCELGVSKVRVCVIGVRKTRGVCPWCKDGERVFTWYREGELGGVLGVS